VITMNKYILRNGQLVFSKPVINIDGIAKDMALHQDFQKQLLILYKGFYKLRHVVNQGKWTDTYTVRLKREFKHMDINTKRSKFGMVPLDRADIITRAMNTLVFVFNSTVQTNDELINATTYDQIALVDRANTEHKILKSVLVMEHNTPQSIKYDFNYHWVDSINDQLGRIDAANESNSTKKRAKGLKLSVPMNVIGFKQYNQTIMNLNESYKLCL